MMRRSAFVLGASLFGCGARGEPAKEQAPWTTTASPSRASLASTTSPLARVTASAAGSASAGPSAEPVPEPKERRPAGGFATLPNFDLFEPVCGLAVFDPDGTRPRFGCRSQPPFDRPGELPDGSVYVVDDVYDVCSADQTFRGAFKRAGAEEAIVGVDLCNPDGGQIANGAQPGFAMLLERHGGEWRYADMIADIDLWHCDSVAQADGRSLLVCESGFAAPPDGGVHFWYVVDFAEAPGKRVKRVATYYDAAFDIWCEPSPSMSPFLEYGITKASTVDHRLVDFDKDGVMDLEIVVDRAHVAPTPSLDKRVAAACKGKERAPSESLLPRGQRFTLQLRGNARSFEPTKASAKLLAAWSAEAPEFWMGAMVTN